jgi:uncharacterized membrane protein YphA (DoxX/SURF4 family)
MADRIREMKKMNARSKEKVLAGVRLILGAVLLWAGVAKAANPSELLGSVFSYDLPLPRFVLELAAVGLPWLEIVLGICLLLNHWTGTALVLSGGLFAMFAMATGQAWARGLEISCGCFGFEKFGWNSGLLETFDSPAAAFVRASGLFIASMILLRDRARKLWVEMMGRFQESLESSSSPPLAPPSDGREGVSALNDEWAPWSFPRFLGRAAKGVWMASPFALMAGGTVIGLLLWHGAVQVAEPKFEGKRIIEWLAEVRSPHASRNSRERALETVRALQPASIEKLREELEAKDRRYHRTLRFLGESQPVFSLGIPTAEERQRKALVVAHLLGADAGPLLPQLERLLERGVLPMQVTIAMGRIGPDGIQSLVKGLGSPYPIVRLHALQAIRSHAEEMAVVMPAILPMLKDKDADLRLVAAQTIRDYGREATLLIPALLEALEDGEGTVRAAAAQALGNLGGEAVQTAGALSRLLEDRNEEVRLSALVALNTVQPEEAVPGLKRALMSENGLVRAFAVVHLRIFTDGPFLIEGLTEAMEDEDALVRREAVKALGALGSRASNALPKLRRVAGGIDKGLAREAQLAIEQVLAEVAKPGTGEGSN